MRQNILPPVIVTHFVSYWSSPLLQLSPSCWLSHEELSSNTRGHVDACCPLFNRNLIQAIIILTRFDLMTLTLTLTPGIIFGFVDSHQTTAWWQGSASGLMPHNQPYPYSSGLLHHCSLTWPYPRGHVHTCLLTLKPHLHLVALHWSCTIFVIHQLASWLHTEADPYSGRCHHTHCHMLNVNHPCAYVSHWATSSFQQESDQRTHFSQQLPLSSSTQFLAFLFFILSIVYVLFKLVFWVLELCFFLLKSSWHRTLH